MDCANVAELLPWLLNGTLDAEVAEAVREHVGVCPGCAAELEQTRSVWALAAGHLPAGALVECEFGTPPASLRRLVEAHLEVCRTCADESRLVRQSRLESDEPLLEQDRPRDRAAGERPTRRAPAGVTRIGPTPMTGGAWRYGTWAAALIAALASGGWVHTWRQAESERTAWQERERGLTARLAQAAAASPAPRDAAAAPRPTGGGEPASTLDDARAEIADLRRRLARAAAPQINPVVVELLPRLADTLRRASGDDAELNALELPRRAAQVTLVLVAGTAGSQAAHEVEIRDQAGAVVWSAHGLLAHTSGDFTLRLPVELLPQGRFQVRLLRADGAPGGRRLVAEYDVDRRAARH